MDSQFLIFIYLLHLNQIICNDLQITDLLLRPSRFSRRQILARPVGHTSPLISEFQHVDRKYAKKKKEINAHILSRKIHVLMCFIQSAL